MMGPLVICGLSYEKRGFWPSSRQPLPWDYFTVARHSGFMLLNHTRGISSGR
jgi:hypothetical protein